MPNEVVNIENDVSGFARAIVAKRVAIIAVVTVILNLAVAHGWVTPDINHQALGWVNTALDAIAGLTTILWVQKDVTPSADPRTDDGEPLVPQSVADARAVAAASPQGGAMGSSVDAEPAAAVEPVVDSTTPAV